MKKKQIYQLILSLILSIGFVAGIPIIIVCAGKSTLGLVVGIIMVVAGFYGTPISWSIYGGNKTTQRVIDAILLDNLLTNSEIASHLCLNETEVKGHIEIAITNRYLVGYIYNGAELKPNNKKNNAKLEPQDLKCSNCGGKLAKTKDGYTCEYCGMTFKDKKTK